MTSFSDGGLSCCSSCKYQRRWSTGKMRGVYCRLEATGTRSPTIEKSGTGHTCSGQAAKAAGGKT